VSPAVAGRWVMKNTSHGWRSISAWMRRTASGCVGCSVTQKSGVARIAAHTALCRRRDSRDSLISAAALSSVSASGSPASPAAVEATGPNRRASTSW
jgi:hypothetical protein